MRTRVWTHRAGKIGAVAAACILGTTAAWSQYNVFYWEDFEGGTFPTSLELRFTATSDVVMPIDWTSANLPAEIRTGIAPTECGRYGLLFLPNPQLKFLAVTNGSTLNRGQLGEKGKALYQADFFVPPGGGNVNSFAVLAVAKDDQNRKSLWRFYRLGVLSGGKVFFGYVDNQKQSGTPVLTRTQDLSAMGIAQDGWHRLQIVFEGQSNILCLVDGVQTNFSPVVEPSLVELQAGIMVTGAADKAEFCYADNLSIQWTQEERALPRSPWREGVAGVGGAAIASPTQSPGAGAGSAAPGGIAWMISPESAWDRCKTENRPILVLFYTPDARAYPSLEQVLMTDRNAQALLGRFVPLRLDANQLRGGKLAQQFGVFRVPTFVVISPDGRERGRVAVEQTTPWSAVASQLHTLAGP